MKRRLCFVLVLCAFAAAPMKADLYSYGFSCITDNKVTDAGIGEAQFFVEVTPGPMEDQVLFTFQNTGPAASSITDIYFYDGMLGDLIGLAPHGDVFFTEGATPRSLPGWPGPAIKATDVFSADSAPPVQPNGINPGESLDVLFTLTDERTFQDVISALNAGITDPMASGVLTIGIHGQGFADGGSESFVHAPLPAAVLLGMLGLGVAGLKLRKRL